MSEICQQVHALFNSLPRHHFPFDEAAIPRNGVYILFERGERAHGVDRIVRVGTHTGDGQLPSRLKQHFLKENKAAAYFGKTLDERCFGEITTRFLNSGTGN
jgi:hypothetical protein